MSCNEKVVYNCPACGDVLRKIDKEQYYTCVSLLCPVVKVKIIVLSKEVKKND